MDLMAVAAADGAGATMAWTALLGLAVALGFITVWTMFAVWLERKASADFQSRLGPMYVGRFHGWLQTVADSIKLAFKEDIIPAESDRTMFCIAPAIAFCGAFAALIAIPAAAGWQIVDLDLGVFFIVAISSIGTIGVIMAGWSSNNKWSLIGGIRAAAQIVSYEIPAGLSILPVVLLAGTLNMQELIEQQGWAPWDWRIFANPFMFVAFFTFFTAALAEGNRTPFDLPEAESELVAGFVTEYSGVRYLIFFMVEWGNLYIIGALLTTLFLGGWQIPPITDNVVLQNVLQFVTFFLKSYFWVLVAMWIRATLPRVRVDQLMSICWKYLVPITFANTLLTAMWMLVWPQGNRFVEIVMFLLGTAIVVQFFRRVAFHLRRARIRERGELYLSPLS